MPYILMATGAGILGGIVAAFWTPGLQARSAVQHFAAGLVIAAVASDLIPEIEKTGSAAGVLGGFAAGGLVMITLKWQVVRFERAEARKHALPVGLAAAAAADTLIDGAIISAGFSSVPSSGSFWRPCSRSSCSSSRCRSEPSSRRESRRAARGWR